MSTDLRSIPIGDFRTLKELSKHYNVTVQALRKAIAEDRLSAYKMGEAFWVTTLEAMEQWKKRGSR